MLSSLYDHIGKKYESKKTLLDAYEKALELILDKNGQWPDKLEWGWTQNRHIIQTILMQGNQLWKEKKSRKAYELFRKLLETNPGDNPGVRYLMLGVLEGMKEKDFNMRFVNNEFWSNDIDDWFSENINKHKEEFSEWPDLFEE